VAAKPVGRQRMALPVNLLGLTQPQQHARLQWLLQRIIYRSVWDIMSDI